MPPVTVHRRLGLIVCVAAATVVPQTTSRLDAQERAPPPVQRPSDVPTTGKMQITVVDSDGRPLPGAAISVSVWTDEPFDHNRDYNCNAGGRVDVQLPRTLRILRVWVDHDGYVPLFAQWWPKLQDNGFPIPEEFAFRLTKGSVIGGIVKNEDGQPIAGAEVEVELTHAEGERDINERPVVDVGGTTCTTDAAGRWSVNNIPPGEAIEVQLKISHPDYVNDRSWGEMQQRQKVTMEALRAQTAAIVMRRGVKVQGTVTDADGKPMAGALVIFGDQPYFQEGSQVRSGAEGTYRFPPLPTGPMTVTVVAEGWRPELRKIEIALDDQPVDFQLQRGKTLRVRFVDRAGKPLPKVSVRIWSWRGSESLNDLDTKIPTAADENGMYEWTWAPEDAVNYHYWWPGGHQAEVSLTADGTDQTVTLWPSRLVISGSVVDSQTGEPIEEFTVIPVLESPDDGLLVERPDAARAGGGQFAFEPQRTDRAYRIRIEAKGYRSAMSERAFRLGDADSTCDFELQPAAPIAGRVLDAKGTPVADAAILLATSSQSIDLLQRRNEARQIITTWNDALVRNTASDGRFSFPAQFERYVIMAFGSDGYAEFEGAREPEESAGDLVFQPFARVEGRLLTGDKPVANTEVSLRPIRPRSAGSPRIDDRYIAVTEGDGRFVFDRVPPVKCALVTGNSIDGDDAVASSESVPLDPRPGQHIAVSSGGGALVRGRVILKGGAGRDIDLKHSVGYLLHRARGIKPPLQVAAKRFDWQKGWSDEFLDTPEGAAYLQTLHHYLVSVGSDGVFRIAGVPQGDFELALRIYRDPAGESANALAARVVRFHVSDADVERGSLDVPDVEIEAPTGR
jgi:protocatechuate 3,4-dioxygenase beta subunit